MSLEAKSLVISLNLEVLEQIRKKNEQNTVWDYPFMENLVSNGGFVKVDVLGTGVVNG